MLSPRSVCVIYFLLHCWNYRIGQNIGNIIKNNRAKAFYLKSVQTYCFHEKEKKNHGAKYWGEGREKHLLKINSFNIN